MPSRKYYRKHRKFKKGLSEQQVVTVGRIVDRKIMKNAELKQAALSNGPVIPVYNGGGTTFTKLTDIPQGVNYAQRIGDQITLKSLHIRMKLTNNQGNTSAIDTVWRVIIFQYFSNDATPVETELFVPSYANQNSGTAIVGSMSALDYNYKTQYRVLYDKTLYTSGSNNQVGTSLLQDNYSRELHFKVPLKFAEKKIRFLSNATTNATNNIYMCVATNDVSKGNNPFYAFNCDLRYTDS